MLRALARRMLPESWAGRLKELAGARRRIARLERSVRTLAALHYPELVASPPPPRAVASPAEPSCPPQPLTPYEFSAHSEGGEDGILLHIFSRIGATDRRFIEIGVGDGRENNTANLALNFGWSGLMIDGSAPGIAAARAYFDSHSQIARGQVQLACAFITRENVNETIARAGFTGELDLFSLDIDGNDFHVWEALEIIQPRVVVIEYNASFGAERAVAVAYDPMFRREDKDPSGWYHGASLEALRRLGERRGYVLVGVESSGFNAFFVRREDAAGTLAKLTTQQAYRPNRNRIALATVEQQYERIRTLPIVQVE